MQKEVELLKSLFLEQGFEQKTLKIQGEKVYRVQIGGLRHYKRESGQIYKSLTTFLNAVMPSNRHLDNWKMNMAAELGSREAVDEYVTALRQIEQDPELACRKVRAAQRLLRERHGWKRFAASLTSLPGFVEAGIVED